MFLIKKKRSLNPTVTLMEIEAPFIAKKSACGAVYYFACR